MKKLVTISLLFIYLLSLVGNSLFIEYLIVKNQYEQVTKIDNGTFENIQLVEIKIPLRLPYYSSSVKYERFYGQVNIKGHHYNYVQRKVLNDTVYLLCLPDYNRNSLEAGKMQMTAGLDNELPYSKKGSEPSGKKYSYYNEYDQFLFTLKMRECISNSKSVANYFDEELMNAYMQPPIKPPSINNKNTKV